MNKSAFLKLIQQVSNISDQQTEELEKVAATFPYCQTAHLLLAKSAYDKGSMLSTQRLRRASSYATDRQLLKRVIYTSLTPEPVFEETEAEELAVVEEESIQALPSEAEATAEDKEAIAVSEEADDLEEVYSHSLAAEVTASEADVDTDPEEIAAEESEDKLDSELALLFTFNSISSSSTDLFLSKTEPEPTESEALLPAVDHYQETGEALAELHAEADEPLEEEAPQPDSLYLEESAAESEVEEATPDLALLPAAPLPEEEVFVEEEPVADSPANPEDAAVNYDLDEIDRLYAEDALGYWMGSSRMGEVLQLKDDYTRQRPQNFHPELILEYTKTHELEKAIQPSRNVLSQQLDIIDHFLKLNPRLKTMANMKHKPEPQEDLSLKSSKIKKGMASENLANIFLQQGKVKKAVKIYEQLILKYPEKKSYFAEQIEKLQNIT
jgi:tetratricopeptide (TPR) repeat protein